MPARLLPSFIHRISLGPVLRSASPPRATRFIFFWAFFWRRRARSWAFASRPCSLRGGGLDELRCADAALLASRRRFFAAGSLARDCDLSTDVSMASTARETLRPLFSAAARARPRNESDGGASSVRNRAALGKGAFLLFVEAWARFRASNWRSRIALMIAASCGVNCAAANCASN